MNEERWEKLKNVIVEWHRPLAPGDGYSEEELAEAEARLGTRFPVALREWYGFAGKWYRAFQVQDEQLSLEALEWEGNTLVFHTENQCVCTWSLHREDINLENPPVYDEQNKILFAETLTDFIVGAVFKEIVSGAETTKSESDVEINVDEGEASERVLSLLEKYLGQALAVSGYEHCFASSEALVVLSVADKAPYPLLFLARTDAAWEKYCALLSAEVQWSD
jgi:hypothetical protein